MVGGREPPGEKEPAVLVRELLTRDATSVRPDTDLDTAVHLLAQHHVSALPVVEDDDTVVGILSEADVLRLHLAADPRAHLRRSLPTPARTAWPRSVAEVMSPDPVVTREGADVSEVARVLADTGWKSMPVVDDARRLVGVVSRSDVIRALSSDDSTTAQRVEQALADLGLAGWDVAVVHGVVTLRGDGSSDPRAAADVAATSRGVREVVVAPPEGR
jgi:CBS domain-containing protein